MYRWKSNLLALPVGFLLAWTLGSEIALALIIGYMVGACVTLFEKYREGR